MSKSKSNKDTNLPETTESQQVRESDEAATTNSPIQIKQKIIQAARFRGPLPLPEDLEAYNRIVPNAAERILRMAEENSVHRRQLERIQVETEADISKSAIKIEARNSIFGLVFAFLICLLAIGGGICLAYIGAQIAGSFISITALSSLVTAFIVGSKSNSDEQTKSDLPKNTNKDNSKI